MMEENNDIFLAGGDALVYLTEPIHKKYSATFVSSDPFSTYVSCDRFFNSPIPIRTCTFAYVLNEWPISQSKNK